MQRMPVPRLMARRPSTGFALQRAFVKHLASAFGVTRLARLTGLDRLGVEVVGAVRPRGHVLQVSQGKGRTLEAARWSALGEAIETAEALRKHINRP